MNGGTGKILFRRSHRIIKTRFRRFGLVFAAVAAGNLRKARNPASLIYEKYRDDFQLLGYEKDSWKIEGKAQFEGWRRSS